MTPDERRAAVRRATSPTAPTTSSASTTCATTWRGRPRSSCSAATTSPSSTRSTRSSSTRPARRSSSAARPTQPTKWYAEFARSGAAPQARRRGAGHRRRLRGRREEAHRRRPRARRREGRGLARHRQPLRVGQHPARRLPQQRDQGQGALPARQGLRRHERRGAHRRRAHRPHPRRPPLQRGHAPGDRGQGGRGDQAGEPDPRHDHPAELLPPLRQALRHDRYGHDRGRRVQPDLQARRRADPDEPADDPRSTRPTSSTAPRRRSSTPSSTTSSSGTRRASRCWSAPRASRSPSTSPSCCASRGVPHEVLNAKHHEREAAIVAQAGRKGAVTVATNMAGRGTDIMLGGNPEFLAVAELAQQRARPGRHPRGVRGGLAGGARAGQEGRGGRARGGRRRSAACTCWAPSATSRAASTTSCAAAPAVRATRASRGSTSRSRTT